MSNYPDGVTDAHPHFNPNERPVTVSCASDESKVIPVTLAFDRLAALKNIIEDDNATRAAVMFQMGHTVGMFTRLAKEGVYECGWEGELELPVSEEAEWTCPRCGTTQTSDTLPDERDPDEGWDSRHDD